MRKCSGSAGVLLAVGLLAGGLGLWGGYRAVSSLEQATGETEETIQKAKPAEQTEASEAEARLAAQPEEARVTESTRMVFEYQSGGATVKRREEEPAFFLLGMSREELAAAYPDWELVEFSAGRAVLRRRMATAEERDYVVGLYEGRIAVFYQEARQGSSLYQLTNIPAAALSPEEQQRLAAGIAVRGEQALDQGLEEYGS